ncbi:MAG TPA: V-type ATP synthase subunit E family protein [Bryobacteraceae bacterium]|nr:V-type ATP synthase subunit E family protein [Bryobacteraceae bacterium]
MAGILGDWVALIAEIKRRAQHRALEREEDASKRTSAILAEANERRATMLRRLEQESELELAAMIRRNSAKGELEARRRFTILREQPIDQVWQDAEARLRALVAQPEYLDVLQRLALLAARELGPGEFVLSGDPVGHSLLTPEVLKQWSARAQVKFVCAQHPADAWGGLLATSGRSRFDATFPTRLAVARRTMRERVFEVLTEEDKQ